MANGKQENPHEWEEYRDLYDQGIWSGGWVLVNGIAYYYTSDGRQFDSEEEALGCGSGCGCGCGSGESSGAEGSGSGSGSGSGCGSGGMHLIPGSDTYTDSSINLKSDAEKELTDFPAYTPELLIQWGGGTFGDSNTPSVTVLLSLLGGTVENAIPVIASWKEPFVVQITDNRFTDIIFYDIPPQYRQ